MKLNIVLAAALALPAITAPAFAAPSKEAVSAQPLPQLGPNARAAYAEIFTLIKSGRYVEATAKLDAIPDGPLNAVARAEIYLGKGSPTVDGAALSALARKAPELPHANELARLAKARGVEEWYGIPGTQELKWMGAAPRRARAPVSDTAASKRMRSQIQPLIKDDRPQEAEAIITAHQDKLPADVLTEWQQRVAWSYYITGDDVAARRLGGLARLGQGAWVGEADWVVGLAAWREKDYATAIEAFEATSRRNDDEDMRAAGSFWAARAYMAFGQPQKVDEKLRAASRNPETFYGLLSLQRLGIKARPAAPEGMGRVENLPNVRAAIALAEIGQSELADKLIRHQARIGDVRDFAALTALAGRIEMPTTQLFLAHHGPEGAQSAVTARYPLPKTWKPKDGWRVDKSLVFAHALQESQFRTNVTSHAGARGLMQVMPGTAAMMARAKGESVGALSSPSENLEYGQSYIEHLRDNETTGGMLPKVIAAYNAGPTPVARWNGYARDGGDPLLYIESIPFWETRAYVTIIMRNYWMYQLQQGDETVSRDALAQGMWPRFPGTPGPQMVRLSQGGATASAD